MTTITWRAGSRDPLVFQPVQPDGTPAPLDGLTMQLRVQAGAQCIALPGVPTRTGGPAQDGFDVSLEPLSDLPPRVYVAAEYYDAGNGWRWIADHTLSIEGGC